MSREPNYEVYVCIYISSKKKKFFTNLSNFFKKRKIMTLTQQNKKRHVTPHEFKPLGARNLGKNVMPCRYLTWA